jgi:hypothetical protein
MRISQSIRACFSFAFGLKNFRLLQRAIKTHDHQIDTKEGIWTLTNSMDKQYSTLEHVKLRIYCIVPLKDNK